MPSKRKMENAVLDALLKKAGDADQARMASPGDNYLRGVCDGFLLSHIAIHEAFKSYREKAEEG